MAKEIMKWIKKLFRRRAEGDLQPLRVAGVGDVPVTPEPDDAELAAQALLEMMADGSGRAARRSRETGGEPRPAEGTREYYEQLAVRIREAREAARQRTLRFLSFCEQQLRDPSLPMTGKGSLSQLETELYKRIDTVEREGGELKRRWQHCLADVTVRLMKMGDGD